MHLLIKIFTLLCFLAFGSHTVAQEICNDAIDNDGDGLIDLNDDDCQCESLIPSSLIPNPSFEDRTCCPDYAGQLDCAVSWIQASEPTTDYLHTCGLLGPTWLGHTSPQPFPDGNGAIGFRDGKPGSPQFKEYTGACLSEPLLAGTTYVFDFFVGFHDDISGRDALISFFGNPECNSIPFGNGNEDFGCPTNGPGWDLLGEIEISGNNEWKNVIFEFTPDKNYEVMVLGPGCAIHPDYRNDPYFFFDRLTLAEKNAFAVPYADISGEACDNSLILSADTDQLGYQWYFNGVAIIGSTDFEFLLTSDSEEGVYEVLIETSSGCFLSEEYVLEFPEAITNFTEEICEGETYTLGTQVLDSAGQYSETFQVGTGCDSTAVVDLIINAHTEFALTESICQGTNIEIAGQLFDSPGNFETILENANGCDSTISIEIIEEFPVQELIVQDTIRLNLGESITLEPTSVSSDAIRFEWLLNETVISNEQTISEFTPRENSVYTINAYTDFDCVTSRSITILIDETINVYVPNVFNPESGNNNKFIIGSNLAVSAINKLFIYDRWGNLVHTYSGPKEQYEGWNGTFNNKLMEHGVYTYFIELEIINGEQALRSGSLLLIR